MNYFIKENKWLTLISLPLIIWSVLFITMPFITYYNINLFSSSYMMLYAVYLGSYIIVVGITLNNKKAMKIKQAEKERLLIVESLAKIKINEPKNILTTFTSMNAANNINNNDIVIIKERLSNLIYSINNNKLILSTSNDKRLNHYIDQFNKTTNTIEETIAKLELFINNSIENNKTIFELEKAKQLFNESPSFTRSLKVQKFKHEMIDLTQDFEELTLLTEECSKVNYKINIDN